MTFHGKHILITGGTGSLGKALLRRLLRSAAPPARVVIFSRDEAKQSALRDAYSLGHDLRELFENRVQFVIGDIRDYATVVTALAGIDTVFNAAALKQVPACEYHAFEAVQTNIAGPENIIRAIQQLKLPVETVVGISTDKACKPVNVMGMTKAIQERLFLSAGARCPNTRFVCVRYGNVLASRGSVVPLFKEQIAAGGPVTITTPEMTRFLLSLDAAVDTVFSALANGKNGETYIPRIPSAQVTSVAAVMIEALSDRFIEIKTTGIRPGEKIHEILVSEEEVPRTYARDGYYVISSVLTPLSGPPALQQEYSSADFVMNHAQVRTLLKENGLA